MALSVKRGDQVSDMRHHDFRARGTRLLNAQVVYFRAASPGACDYVDDGRHGPWPHGVCWSELCAELEVVDVPGDHFSLLRQDAADMELMVSHLKRVLGPFGWAEVLRRDRPDFKLAGSEVAELDRCGACC